MGLISNVEHVLERIRHAERCAQRPQGSVRLIAVTKGQPSETLRAGYDAGLREFGENYLSEALKKMEDLKDLPDLVWHFIGPIQSNKTRLIAEHFDWVHSIDREKVAIRLNQGRPLELPPLDVCIQVNVRQRSQEIAGIDAQSGA